eukprot:3158874-Pyramimonas_sp.AAC.1
MWLEFATPPGQRMHDDGDDLTPQGLGGKEIKPRCRPVDAPSWPQLSDSGVVGAQYLQPVADPVSAPLPPR